MTRYIESPDLNNPQILADKITINVVTFLNKFDGTKYYSVFFEILTDEGVTNMSTRISDTCIDCAIVSGFDVAIKLTDDVADFVCVWGEDFNIAGYLNLDEVLFSSECEGDLV